MRGKLPGAHGGDEGRDPAGHLGLAANLLEPHRRWFCAQLRMLCRHRGAFLGCNSTAGWTVAASAVLHEIPHEVADLMALVNGGMSNAQVIMSVLQSSKQARCLPLHERTCPAKNRPILRVRVQGDHSKNQLNALNVIRQHDVLSPEPLVPQLRFLPKALFFDVPLCSFHYHGGHYHPGTARESHLGRFVLRPSS